MKVYAIGDLHLPGGDDKPMEVFGAHWEGHWQKIKQDWLEKVSEEDIVISAGANNNERILALHKLGKSKVEIAKELGLDFPR